MSRQPVIAANWKMNLKIETAKNLTLKILEADLKLENKEVILFPSFLQITTVISETKGSEIKVGGQNISFEDEGAFTGEVAASQLIDTGCTHVLVGHSERRHYFQEDYEVVNAKVLKALNHKLKVMLCVGESLEEREKKITEMVVIDQLESAFQNVDRKQLKNMYIAYEPIWAIGTGKTATTEDASHVHQMIRKTLRRLYDENACQEMQVLYGGSVKPDNVSNFMNDQHIDGVLVGGASLKAPSFKSIINFKQLK